MLQLKFEPVQDIGYMSDKEFAAVEKMAIDRAGQYDEDLWSMCHSIVIDAIEWNAEGGGKLEYVSHKHGDGIYEYRGLIDANALASFVAARLQAKARFEQERAENDKSG